MERSSDERRITLSELLDSREKRAMHQQELLKRDNSLLVSVTLNIPGPVKDRPIYRKVMDIALERLISSLPEGFRTLRRTNVSSHRSGRIRFGFSKVSVI